MTVERIVEVSHVCIGDGIYLVYIRSPAYALYIKLIIHDWCTTPYEIEQSRMNH